MTNEETDNYITTRVKDNSWDVFNEKNNNRYQVDYLDKGGWKCNCPHWLYRLKHTRGKCKHILLVQDTIEKESTYEGM